MAPMRQRRAVASLEVVDALVGDDPHARRRPDLGELLESSRHGCSTSSRPSGSSSREARDRLPRRPRRRWRRSAACVRARTAARTARIRSTSAPLPTFTLSVLEARRGQLAAALGRRRRLVGAEGAVADDRAGRPAPSSRQAGSPVALADQIEQRDVDAR